MAITAGTINSAEPAQALYDAINSALAANPNWTRVDADFAYTRSAINRVASVWKCAGAGNLPGTDYYAIVSRPTAAGSTTVGLSLAEGYTVGTHTVSNFAASSNLTNAQGANSQNNPSTLSTFSPMAEPTITILASVAADYFINVTNSRLAVAVNQIQAAVLTRMAFATMPYTPVAGRGVADAVPVFLFGSIGAAVLICPVIRMPPLTSGPNTNFTHAPYAPIPVRGNLTASGINPGPDIAGAEAVPAALRWTGTVAPWDTNVNKSSGPLGYAHRGAIPNAVIVGETDTVGYPKNGDTLTIGSDTYVRFGGGSSIPNVALWLKDVAY